MSSTTAALRQRTTTSTKKTPVRSNPNGSSIYDDTDVVRVARGVLGPSQLGYKLALGLLTILAFATRFYGLGHPNQVVFDEVHFGKVGGYMDDDGAMTLSSPCAELPDAYHAYRANEYLIQTG